MMFRRAALLFIAVSLVGVLPASISAQDDKPLGGAWLVVKVEPADDEVVEEPEPALFIFTDTHYSVMAAIPGEGNELRPTFANSEEPTDAEKVEAYDSFFANSGRYEVKGDSVTTRAFVAKDPNYMDAWPENANSFQFRVEGDTLYWHFGETIVTLERVEGTEAPY